jgi:transmembrane sensor
MSDDKIGDLRLRRGPDPDEEAMAWLMRQTSGEMTEAEMSEFARWRASPANEAAFAELDNVWGGIGQAFERPDNVVTLRPRMRRRVATWERRVAAIAASLLVFAMSQQYLSYWQYDAAPRGSQRGHADLADGSRIELNTGAALKVDYGADARRVTLARGEAIFDVKRDPTKPFIISAGGGEVWVLGTAFSVAREGKGARVTVIRGKVRVSSAGQYVDIVPNQMVVFDTGAPGAVRKVDAKMALAWSDGRLIFRGRPLREVVDAVDRYYPGAIILTSSEAGNRKVDAVVNLNKIDDWIRTLQKSQALEARRVPGVLILS